MPHWSAAAALASLERPAQAVQERSLPIAAPVNVKAAAAASSQAVSIFARNDNNSQKPTAPFHKSNVREMGSVPPAGQYPTSTHDSDKAIGRSNGIAMPTPLLSFNGLSNFDNIDIYQSVIIPPDTIGDVGPNHYVQAVNALVRIFDKSGNALIPPFRMSQLFAPLGTACSVRDDGEPVVLYRSAGGQMAAQPILQQLPSVSADDRGVKDRRSDRCLLCLRVCNAEHQAK